MTSAQRLAVGFALGGALTLLIHPGSRQLMVYCLQRDKVSRVLETNPISSGPTELFPPGDVKGMPLNEMFLTAFRISQRLTRFPKDKRSPDIAIARTFSAQAERLDADNSFWPQFSAALADKDGDVSSAMQHWRRAVTKIRWETGTPLQVTTLWTEMQQAEGLNLAWQGTLALGYRSEDQATFVTDAGKAIANTNMESRFLTLLNSGQIMNSATTFATGAKTLEMANVVTFGFPDPRARLSPPRINQIRSKLKSDFGVKFGQSALVRTAAQLREVDSWEQFVLPAQRDADNTLKRLRLESVLTATLPSALLFASAILAAVALSGTLLSILFERTPHPNSNVIYVAASVFALFIFLKTSALLLAVWCFVIGILMGLPVEVAKTKPVGWNAFNTLTMRVLALAVLFLFAVWLISASPAALHMSVYGQTGGERGVAPKSYEALAVLTLSFVLPCAAVWARLKQRPVLYVTGESLRVVGLVGSLVGLISAIILTPICIYRDAQNRILVEQWIQNEPKTFRLDQP